MNERLEEALKWCEENKERLVSKPKWSYQANKKNREAFNKYHREYRVKSAENLLTERIRHLMNYSLRRKGIARNGKSWQLLGYSVEQLKERLTGNMPGGYKWNDFLNGKLDIDHIKPVNSFDYNNTEDKGFKECWRLDNLRLLTVYENRSRLKNRYDQRQRVKGTQIDKFESVGT